MLSLSNVENNFNIEFDANSSSTTISIITTTTTTTTITNNNNNNNNILRQRLSVVVNVAMPGVYSGNIHEQWSI